MAERVRNAPVGVFTYINTEHEDLTYDWELVDDSGDFTIWRYFDGPGWVYQYCACFKGKAFVKGDSYGGISNALYAAQQFFALLSEIQ